MFSEATLVAVMEFGASIIALIPEILAFGAAFLVVAGILATIGTVLWGLLQPLGQLVGFKSAIDDNLNGPFSSLHLTMKDLPSVFAGFVDTIKEEWPLVTKLVSDMWTDMINSMLNKIGNLANETQQYMATGPIGAYLGIHIGALDTYNTGRPTNSASGDIAKLSKALQGNIAKELLAASGFRGAEDTGLTGKPVGSGTVSNIPTDATTGADAYKRARDALQSLENELAHFAGPAMKFVDDQDKLNLKIREMMTNVVDAKGHIKSYGATWDQVRAVFAHVGFDDLTKSIDKNGKAVYDSEKMDQAELRTLMGLKNTDLDLAQATDLATLALQHHAVTADQAAEYIRKATVANELYNLSLLKTADAGRQIAIIKFNEGKDTASKIAEDITTKALKTNQEGNLETYNIQLAQLNHLIADGTISNEAYVKSVMDIQRAYLDTKTDAMSGFQKGLLDVQKTMFDVSGDAAKVMTDAFNGLNDALVNFATTGKIDFKSMATSILKDMDSLIIKTAIMQPLMSFLGLAPGQGGGLPGSPQGGGGFLSDLFGKMFGGANGGGLGSAGQTPLTPMYVSIVGGPGGLPGMPGSPGGGGIMDEVWGAVKGAGSWLGGLLGFRDGADFQVGGVGGYDSQLIAFRASPDERVTVQTPEQQRRAQKAAASGQDMGGIHLHLHGVQDFDSFKKSKSQIATGLAQITSRSVRRNGH